jgi:nucleotide-binding universal stress UspA family protein
MAQPTSSRRKKPEPLEPGGEVVVGLTCDGSLEDVARAAVDLAGTLGVRVRFVHVLPEERSTEGLADSGSAAFAAAMAALRHGDQRGATFESLRGSAAPTLVARSQKAIALVVGEDRPQEDGEVGSVAAYCRRHAWCPVHVVPHRG